MGKSSRRSPRRFLKTGTSPRDFFEDLEAAGCRYVVLRWFERLPDIEAGEDIDMLVHDEDVDKVRELLRPRPLSAKLLGRRNLIRCDVYSVYGLRGSSYQGISYYPPHLAQGILERAVRHHSGAMVPSDRDHFYSLAFHALYHKGLRSGLPVSVPGLQSHSEPEHDYGAVLRRLADEIGIAVEIEMNALDDELARAGWRPPIDFMERIRPDDAWIQARVAAHRAGSPVVPGLAVFIVRERALDRSGAIDTITELLREDGFNVLAVDHLSPELQKTAEQQIRGGNWGRGPWATSGGPPAVAIAALDVFPNPPSARLLVHHPRCDNRRVFATKDRIRDRANEGLAAERQSNVVHSSDNAAEAVSHIELLFPDASDAILEAAARLVASVDVPADVVRRLDRGGRRAIVELIRRTDGSLAVRKRFRPGKEEFFDRELQALTTLRAICPDVVPEILEQGENYLVMPYYADTRTRIGGRLELPIPLPALRKAFISARAFFDHGIVLGDFRPHNLVVEDRNRIKIIDYEDAHERLPNEAPSEFAALDMFRSDAFDRGWGRAAGLSVHNLMNDPMWKLYARRWTLGYPSAAASALRKARRSLMRRIERHRQRTAVRHARRLPNAPRQA
jgi:predicted Ser/Thr protein kinase